MKKKQKKGITFKKPTFYVQHRISIIEKKKSTQKKESCTEPKCFGEKHKQDTKKKKNLRNLFYLDLLQSHFSNLNISRFLTWESFLFM